MSHFHKDDHLKGRNTVPPPPPRTLGERITALAISDQEIYSTNEADLVTAMRAFLFEMQRIDEALEKRGVEVRIVFGDGSGPLSLGGLKITARQEREL